MDVLGFANYVDLSFKAGEGQIALDRFYQTFTQKLKSTFNRETEGKYRSWDVKVFTDNILLGYTFDSWHAEEEFDSISDKVGIYQLLMALDNYFIRGGIAVGQLFLDDNTAFGPALLEAHRIESELASNPRILLSPEVVDLVRRQTKFYGNPSESPQNQMVLVDNTDGAVFIHYLHYVLFWNEYEDGVERAICADILAKHKDNVIRNLEIHKASPRVWAKYQWVASYHNYFCEQCREFANYNDDLYIERRLLAIKPTSFMPFVQ